MIYYDKNNKPVEINYNNMDKVERNGACSTVYHNNKIIFKKYHSFMHNKCRLNKKMFNKLKDIHNKNFIELHNIYTEKRRLIHQTDAYTAKYYKAEKINILEMPTDYLLDNFRDIELLFKIFSDERIVTNDVKNNNSIKTANSIIVIDPDLFYTSIMPKKEIIRINKIEILRLLRTMIVDCIKVNEYEKTIKKMNTNLINYDITADTDIIKELSKKLKPYKKPIDFFKN